MIQIARHAAEQAIACLRDHATEIVDQLSTSNQTAEIAAEVEDWLRLAIEAFAWIKVIDERSLELHREGLGTYDPEEDESIHGLYRSWLTHASDIGALLAARSQSMAGNVRVSEFLEAIESATDEMDTATRSDAARQDASENWAATGDIWPDHRRGAAP